MNRIMSYVVSVLAMSALPVSVVYSVDPPWRVGLLKNIQEIRDSVGKLEKQTKTISTHLGSAGGMKDNIIGIKSATASLAGSTQLMEKDTTAVEQGMTVRKLQTDTMLAELTAAKKRHEAALAEEKAEKKKEADAQAMEQHQAAAQMTSDMQKSAPRKHKVSW